MRGEMRNAIIKTVIDATPISIKTHPKIREYRDRIRAKYACVDNTTCPQSYTICSKKLGKAPEESRRKITEHPDFDKLMKMYACKDTGGFWTQCNEPKSEKMGPISVKEQPGKLKEQGFGWWLYDKFNFKF